MPNAVETFASSLRFVVACLKRQHSAKQCDPRLRWLKDLYLSLFYDNVGGGGGGAGRRRRRFRPPTPIESLLAFGGHPFNMHTAEAQLGTCILNTILSHPAPPSLPASAAGGRVASGDQTTANSSSANAASSSSSAAAAATATTAASAHLTSSNSVAKFLKRKSLASIRSVRANSVLVPGSAGLDETLSLNTNNNINNDKPPMATDGLEHQPINPAATTTTTTTTTSKVKSMLDHLKHLNTSGGSKKLHSVSLDRQTSLDSTGGGGGGSTHSTLPSISVIATTRIHLTKLLFHNNNNKRKRLLLLGEQSSSFQSKDNISSPHATPAAAQPVQRQASNDDQHQHSIQTAQQQQQQQLLSADYSIAAAAAAAAVNSSHSNSSCSQVTPEETNTAFTTTSASPTPTPDTSVAVSRANSHKAPHAQQQHQQQQVAPASQPEAAYAVIRPALSTSATFRPPLIFGLTRVGSRVRLNTFLASGSSASGGGAPSSPPLSSASSSALSHHLRHHHHTQNHHQLRFHSRHQAPPTQQRQQYAAAASLSSSSGVSTLRSSCPTTSGRVNPIDCLIDQHHHHQHQQQQQRIQQQQIQLQQQQQAPRGSAAAAAAVLASSLCYSYVDYDEFVRLFRSFYVHMRSDLREIFDRYAVRMSGSDERVDDENIAWTWEHMRALWKRRISLHEMSKKCNKQNKNNHNKARAKKPKSKAKTKTKQQQQQQQQQRRQRHFSSKLSAISIARMDDEEAIGCYAWRHEIAAFGANSALKSLFDSTSTTTTTTTTTTQTASDKYSELLCQVQHEQAKWSNDRLFYDFVATSSLLPYGVGQATVDHLLANYSDCHVQLFNSSTTNIAASLAASASRRHKSTAKSSSQAWPIVHYSLHILFKYLRTKKS